jgi:uncharacterized membrane protein
VVVVVGNVLLLNDKRHLNIFPLNKSICYANIVLIIIFCWLLVTFNFSKTLMVLLLCLTFVGQAMASTIMSYHMMSMTGMNDQNMSQDMAMMDHSNHNMLDASADNSTTSSEECCTETCNCFTGGCSNVVAFMTISGNVPIISSPAKILSSSRLAQSQQPVSLYRPPILS